MFDALQCISVLSDKHFLITNVDVHLSFVCVCECLLIYYFLAVLSCVCEVIDMVAKSRRRMSVMFWQNKLEELGVQSHCCCFQNL